LPRVGIALAALAVGLLLYGEHRQALQQARLASRPLEAEELDRYTAAEDRATAALDRNPRDVIQLLKRSMARQKRGDLARDHGRSPLAFYAAALEDLDRAVAIDMQSMDLQVQRARVLTQRAVYKSKYGLDPLPDIDAAEKILADSVSEAELRPLRGNLRYHRGMWLNRLGGNGRPYLEMAEADLTPAADTDSYLRRGRVRTALGKLAEADNDFAIALDKRPRDGWGWVRRAEGRLAAGDLQTAERYLDEAIKFDNLRADAHEVRGHVRFARGDFANALSDYAEAVARNPALIPMLTERMNQTRAALKGK